MNEVIFIVEEAPEGAPAARALEYYIVTEADDLASLSDQVRDTIRCHIDEGRRRKAMPFLSGGV